MPIEGNFLSNDMVERLAEGDPRCSINVGETIVKTDFQSGDRHPIGSKGVVIGNLQIPNPILEDPVDTYLIHFESDPEEHIAFMANINNRIVKESEYESLS